MGALRLVCGQDAYLAEELAQEAVARLCRDWDKVSQGPSPRAWLHRVGINLAMSHWRRQRVRRRALLRLDQEPTSPDPSMHCADKDQLRAALQLLSERERSVIVLRHYLQYNVTETAAVLKVSGQAVRNLHHRAMRRLRAAVELKLDEVEST